MKALALVDCNNFYASCERVFNPKLNNKPVVILSNNDGCIIARSNEAKALGVPMGVPFFKISDLIRKEKIYVFSSNYALYGDLSHRVMETLEPFSPHIEIYSIDEAFLMLEGRDSQALTLQGQKIVQTVKQWVGLPISVGIAPTKTLTKVANYFVKQNPEYKGVLCLTEEAQRQRLLNFLPLEDIWGIGRGSVKTLMPCGIKTALDFYNQSSTWVRKKMGVVGARIHQELHGVSCLGLEEVSPSKKGICCSRSFGRAITTLTDMEEAVSTYTARGAEKLREEGLKTMAITVFIKTSPHRGEYESQGITSSFLTPTLSTRKLVTEALKSLRQIFIPGLRYKKAGIYFHSLSTTAQGSFFEKSDSPREERLMKVMDQINLKMGEGTLRVASQGIERSWRHKSQKRSPAYTTSWKELPWVS